MLLTREWLGSMAEPSSPSGNAKKLGYDLFRTKGFKLTTLEKSIEALQEEWVKQVVKIVSTVVIVSLLLWFLAEKY